MRAAGLLVAVTGCAGVFGLNEGVVVDARTGPGPCTALDGMHDEDCDGVSDLADLCPGVADDQRDDDGDAVGNACDPEPGMANTRLAFSAFTDAENNDWAPFGGSWAVHDDALFSTNTVDGNEGGALFVPKVDFTSGLRLEARIAVDSIGTDDENYKMSVLGLGIDGANQGFSCEHDRKPSNGGFKDVVEVFLPNSGSKDVTDGNSKLGPGAVYTVRLTITAQNVVTCQWIGDQGDGATVMLASTSTDPGVGSIGFMSERVAMHVLSIDAVQINAQ